LPAPLSYEQVISDFYDEASVQVAEHLDAGRDVAVICEGDPFFYGSYMYLHDRLADRYDTEVVPGVCSMLGSAARMRASLITTPFLIGTLRSSRISTRLPARSRSAMARTVIKHPELLAVRREMIPKSQADCP